MYVFANQAPLLSLYLIKKGNGLSSTQPPMLSVTSSALEYWAGQVHKVILGVYISDTLGAGKQIEYMLKICNQWLYLLNQLKKQGLSKQKLNNIFNAIVMSRLTYATAAWRGYASSAECNNIQGLTLFIWWTVLWGRAGIRKSPLSNLVVTFTTAKNILDFFMFYVNIIYTSSII